MISPMTFPLSSLYDAFTLIPPFGFTLKAGPVNRPNTRPLVGDSRLLDFSVRIIPFPTL